MLSLYFKYLWVKFSEIQFDGVSTCLHNRRHELTHLCSMYNSPQVDSNSFSMLQAEERVGS